ncbi:MAG: cysteine desulfurase family protein [Bryobacterales bacterium]|nr:cysteine desulfurase [Bryobacteraceae bacterium]MDW8131404.1 cysteine desulfurase family protein [Bryobacterales bacterium]
MRAYFDHNATTPVASEVLEAMRAVFLEDFGNASSVHAYGQAARRRLEQARREVALQLGVAPGEIVFTSGGTEADNLAILGLVRNDPRPRKHVITTAIEHPAVLEACAQLEREGVEVTRVPPDSRGVVDPDAVRRALRAQTVLVSVMHVNNELGTIQPVAEIARLAREAGAWVHSDGVQAVGKLRVNLRELGVDLYSISAHKIYGPKGVGALYVRQGVPVGRIQFGGHQERDRRPGTENVPGAVGLATALSLVGRDLDRESWRLTRLRERFEEGVLARIPEVVINGAGAPRCPNTSNLTFRGVDGEALLIALDLAGFAVSSGAACSSGASEPSHVLSAIGLGRREARGSVRVSMGRLNDERQVDALVEALAEAVTRLRALAPAEERV